MRKIVLTAAVMAALCACNGKEEKTPDEPLVPEETSVSISADLEGFAWAAGDRISILENGVNHSLVTWDNGTSAVFSGESLPAEGVRAFGVFPYKEDYDLSATGLKVYYPSELPVLPGVTTGGIAVAPYNSDKLAFKYINAFIEFTVSSEDAKSVSVVSDASHPLSGDFLLRFADDGAVAMVAGSEVFSEVGFEAEPLQGTYRIPVPAGQYDSLKVRFSSPDGAVERVMYDISPKAGEVVSFGVIDGGDGWILPPAIESLGSTSSTVAFTWSVTGFEEPVQDIAEPWTAAVYADAACTELVALQAFTKDDWMTLGGVSIYAYAGPYSPRVVFGGLQAGKDYWCKVWRTECPASVSKVLRFSTADYAPVGVSGTVGVGDYALDEDFSELVAGDDLPLFAHGSQSKGAEDFSSTRLEQWTMTGVASAPGHVRLSDVSSNITTAPLDNLASKSDVTVKFKVYPYKAKVFGDLGGSVKVMRESNVLSNTSFTLDAAELWQEMVFDLTVPKGGRISISGKFSVDELSVKVNAVYNDTKLYSISNASELQSFLDCTDLYDAADEAVVLQNDIDLAGVTLKPGAFFAGVLDGAGKTIHNWKTSSALIGNLSGTVKDLNIAADCSMEIPANDDCAFIALENSGTIENCVNNAPMATVSGAVFDRTSERCVGAIAAVSSGKVLNCSNTGNITLAPESTSAAVTSNYFIAAQYVGGIVGRAKKGSAKAEITGCTNSGTVRYSCDGFIGGRASMGGILGGTAPVVATAQATWAWVDNVMVISCENHGDVVYSYDVQNASALNVLNIGGVAGYVEGGVKDSQNSGAVSVTTPKQETTETRYLRCSKVGGIAGTVSGDLSGCSNSGAVTQVSNISNSSVPSSGDQSGWRVEYCGRINNPCLGGVVGEGPLAGTIADCHNTGDVTVDVTRCLNASAAFYVAGIAGYVTAGLTGCTNSGTFDVTAQARTMFVGGVCGYTNKVVTDCHNNGGSIKVNQTDAPDNEGVQHTQLLRVGGVLGYSGLANPISGSSNKASITVESNPTDGLYVGGVIGQANSGTGRITSCNNQGGADIDVTAGGSVKLARIGGVAGLANGGFTNCSNEASLVKYTGGAWDGSNFNEIGGIAGRSAGQQIQGSATEMNVNKADVVVETPSRLRVGGVAACCTQNTSYVRNEGDITVNHTHTDVNQSGTIQEIGGVFGYGTTVNYGSSTGNVKLIRDAHNAPTDNAHKLNGVGLFMGFAVGANCTFTSCSASGTVSAEFLDTFGNKTPVGLASGALNTGITLTLGGASAPFTIGAGSACGTSVVSSAADLTDALLVGNLNGGSLTKTNLTLE